MQFLKNQKVMLSILSVCGIENIVTRINQSDYIIIGGGIVGLTIARALLMKDAAATVLVLEKEERLGLHGSGRNSGVVHSGIYYSPETLKAKICTSGARAMIDYCENNNLPMDKMGKVIVSTKPDNDSQINFLYERAIANGVKVEVLDKKQLKEREPHANSRCEKALYSPNTSVVDSKSVLEHVRKEFVSMGGDIKYGHKVIDADPDASKIITTHGIFFYKKLFNASGQYSDKVAKLFQVGKAYTMLPFRGQYYKLENIKKYDFNGLIYPVPDLNFPFLGVHTVKTVSNEIYFGPSAIPALGRENYSFFKNIEISDSVNITYQLFRQFYHNRQNFRKYAKEEIIRVFDRGFIDAIKSLVPDISKKDIVKCNKVGIRAQLVDLSKKELVGDFVVEGKDNTVHVLNAVSPAFTCSFAFAEWLIEKY